MSVFTTVTPDELGAWLNQYEVGALKTLKGISAGIENTNYVVTTNLGRYVLTLFEKLKRNELPFYLNLMAHLAEQGIPSPKPIANRAGQLLGALKGKPTALVSFLPGKDIAEPAPQHCAMVGAVLANIHLAGRSYAARMDNPRGPGWWTAVMPEIIPFMADDDAGLLREEVRFQSRHYQSGLACGAIHADLFRDNVLFDGARLAGVIDFYFACTDVLLYDVAITVNDWCVYADGSLDLVRMAALLDAYRTKRPFSAPERSAWPQMLRAAALRFWVSRLYDFHLPRPGELTHAKDPNHFRRILASHIQHGRELPPLVI